MHDSKPADRRAVVHAEHLVCRTVEQPDRPERDAGRGEQPHRVLGDRQRADGNAQARVVVDRLAAGGWLALQRVEMLRLAKLREAIERASGVPLQPHEPIVGEGVFSHESGIHTAAILVHPAIYQFIREETVGGTHRFVFGKHSGTAAVEAVLEKHADLLAAQGVTMSESLVGAVLERVKELRETMIVTGHHARAVDDYYRNYDRLGISETGLVELALECAVAARVE